MGPIDDREKWMGSEELGNCDSESIRHLVWFKTVSIKISPKKRISQ